MSAKTVAEKLLIKPDSTVWISPAERLELIAPLPERTQAAAAIEDAQAAVIFADDAASVQASMASLGAGLREPEILWVAYPKGNKSDINRDTLWPLLSAHGLRPIGQVAIDDVWSALRFRPEREGEKPFRGGGP
jgi:hypothetical protein